MNSSKSNGREVYKVVSPIGKWGRKIVPLAPRLDTLNGKTIFELGAGAFRSDITFPMLEQMLKERYTNITFIPSPPRPETDLGELIATDIAKLLKDNKVDAVITGNGG